jgi:hypothetical protein
MSKLDRKRSYGTVYGDPHIGYEQDQLQFKHDGTLHEPLKATPPVVAAIPTVESLSAQLAPPQVLEKLDSIASQLKELQEAESKAAEPRAPDPARSEAARRIWIERRAREAAAQAEAQNATENTPGTADDPP